LNNSSTGSIDRLPASFPCIPANSGTGSSLHGGRWNPPGVEVIYASATISLAVLEILVHYSVLPKDFVATAIEIPETIQRRRFADPSWTVDTPLHITQADGGAWIRERLSAMTSVPSFVVPSERNYLLNPSHSDFAGIMLDPSEPFRFDPRIRPVL
jgi:RES domain-containing protein